MAQQRRRATDIATYRLNRPQGYISEDRTQIFTTKNLKRPKYLFFKYLNIHKKKSTKEKIHDSKSKKVQRS